MRPAFKSPPGPLGRAVFRLARRRGAAHRAPPSPSEVADLLRDGAIGWSEAVDAGAALYGVRRCAEADAVFERALTAFPADATLSISYALSAHIAGLYRIAIERWQAALRVADGDPMCHFCLAANFRELGDIENAERVIAPALQRFPRDPGVLCEAARVAEGAGRFGDALALWAKLARRWRATPDWLRGHAHALLVLGRFEAAEQALAAALARHPSDAGLLAVQAMLASAREDWPRALALWSDYRARFPDDKTGWEHHGRAVQASAFVASATPSLLAPLEVARVDDDAIRDLMLRFESIGDNCEFGSVQRRYGAEPLGLLRWNDVGFDNLVEALGARFAGMGEPAHTEMPTLVNGEFVVRDRRWGLWMHTFLFEGQVDRDDLYAKMRRRVAYLRDKLVSDLEAAEKIAVFRSTGLDRTRLGRLHAALAEFGPVRLLSVQPGDAASGFTGAPGTVDWIDAGIAVGFVSRLGVAEGNYWDIAFEDWVAVCRAALSDRAP